MTVAIKRENSDLIWLDTVIQFGKTYQTSVTKHKLASGANVTDHVIEENPAYSISGIVSGVDFSLGKPILSEEDIKTYGIGREINKEQITAVIVNSATQSPLVKLLPDSIKQFLTSDTPPTVTMQQARVQDANPIATVEKILVALNRGTPTLVRGRVINRKELVTLIEFDPAGKIINTYPNCVLTSLGFRETADTGYALYPEMTFEQVRFATLQKTTIPANVASAIKNKAATNSEKGKQQTNDGTTDPTGADAKSGPTDLQTQGQRGAAYKISKAAEIADGVK